MMLLLLLLPPPLLVLFVGLVESYVRPRSIWYELYCENPTKEQRPRPTKIVRELPRKMNIEEVEGPRKVRELPREARFRPFQKHRRTPKSTRITTKNELGRSWGSRKLRKFTCKTRPPRPRPPRKYTKSAQASTKVLYLPRVVFATSDLNPGLLPLP